MRERAEERKKIRVLNNHRLVSGCGKPALGFLLLFTGFLLHHYNGNTYVFWSVPEYLFGAIRQCT